jgi:hypothetical protein
MNYKTTQVYISTSTRTNFQLVYHEINLTQHNLLFLSGDASTMNLEKVHFYMKETLKKEL